MLIRSWAVHTRAIGLGEFYRFNLGQRGVEKYNLEDIKGSKVHELIAKTQAEHDFIAKTQDGTLRYRHLGSKGENRFSNIWAESDSLLPESHGSWR